MTESNALSSFKGALALFSEASKDAGPSAGTVFRYMPTDENPSGPSIKEIYDDGDPSVSLDQRKLYVLSLCVKQLENAGKDLLSEHQTLLDAQARADKTFRSQSAAFTGLDNENKRLRNLIKKLGTKFEDDFTEYAMARAFAVPQELLELIVQFIDQEADGVGP